jgi:DNA-binding NarL/FixJ family response regulator
MSIQSDRWIREQSMNHRMIEPFREKMGSRGAIQIGLVSDEPIWIEGIAAIFDQRPQEGHAQLTPVTGSIEELLAVPTLRYMVVDLNASSNSLKTLAAIRSVRPDIRPIVIGPKDEELVIDAIVAGARAYLDSAAVPETVLQAIQVVVSGSIWAPRQLLSRLIDRLLSVPNSSPVDAGPRLTSRERQVLDLILAAHSNREIGRQLGIEERTVKAHVGRLLRKTGADNRIELSIRALNRSLPPQDGA